MASRRQTLLNNVKATLEAIATPTFQNDVEAVFFSTDNQINIDEQIAIIINDQGDESKRHIRLMNEGLMTLDLRALGHDWDRPTRVTDLDSLRADIEEAIMADETQGGIAVKTFVQRNIPSYGEGKEPLGDHALTVAILYRTNRLDPTAGSTI